MLIVSLEKQAGYGITTVDDTFPNTEEEGAGKAVGSALGVTNQRCAPATYSMAAVKSSVVGVLLLLLDSVREYQMPRCDGFGGGTSSGGGRGIMFVIVAVIIVDSPLRVLLQSRCCSAVTECDPRACV